MGGNSENSNYNISTVFKRRKMLSILENIFMMLALRELLSGHLQKKKFKILFCNNTSLYRLGASSGTYFKIVGNIC